MVTVRFDVRNSNPNTIYNRLRDELGREPRNEELRCEVNRILGRDAEVIELAVYPAIATPGKFVVASMTTGNVLSVDNNFDRDAPTRYFSSVDDARKFVASLPQTHREYRVTYPRD